MQKKQLNGQKMKAVSLDEKQVVSFKRPLEIFITSGKVWITTTGDSQDYIYGEGESFKVPSGKHTVVQALGRASFWF